VSKAAQSALFDLDSGDSSRRGAEVCLPLPTLHRPEGDAWPAPPAAAVFNGAIGELVGVLAPASEADPVAILVQLLVALGALVGRGPHYRVGASRHGTNEFAVLVGPSGSGRKGSSWDIVEAVLAGLEESFVAERVVAGLSSGEGLIWHVRDGQQGAGGDKRLLVLEPELASVLKAASREQSTLSPVLRNAWDGRTLQLLTKHDAARSAAAHICLIGHITATELVRHVSALEMANGFMNRFLIFAVRRVRLLPEGGEPDKDLLAKGMRRLRAPLRRARASERLTFDDEARQLWWASYPALSAGAPGLLGALLGRAEAHVVRLALIYALFDGNAAIGVAHLEAALALWDYAARSAAFVFGASLGDRVADEIWQAVAKTKGGITRSQIRDLFDRNKARAEIDAALAALVASGRVERSVVAGRGRPTEIWSARQAT
jgi:hypothetical protein